MIIRFKTYQIIITCVLVLPLGLQANNIQVSNATVNGQNTTTKTANVQFNLSWENSWRTTSAPNNWDAAWVFVKFRVGESDPTFTGVSSSGTTVTVSSTAKLRVGMPVVVTGGQGQFRTDAVISSITNATQFVIPRSPIVALSNASIVCYRQWEQAALDTADGNHTAPSGSTINAPNDSTGVFIYRSTAGSGTNTWNNVGLRWKYGSNGVADNSYIEVKVFAIEMVYVPEGSFYVGSGGTETGSFTDGSWTSGNTIPYQITSEAALGIDNVAGKLWGTDQSGDSTIGNNAADPEATLAAAFPKGYAAFYCMKYEISQGDYRDFLNTLSREQQNNRTSTPLGLSTISVTDRYVMTQTTGVLERNGIRCDSSIHSSNPIVFYCDFNGNGIGDEAADGEWIACNYLSWMDGCAYMDWAGLRPMTELEYEKACRGNQSAVADEYAWGTSTIASAAYTISNTGAAVENIATNYSTTAGNAAYFTTSYSSIGGPLRGGIFAANGSNSGRISAGASYYGIMDLSGNLWERTVTIGDATGRNFTGLSGDGRLSPRGRANQSQWPGLFSGELTRAIGSNLRGGAWSQAVTGARVSDRTWGSVEAEWRNDTYGFRGVRSAP